MGTKAVNCLRKMGGEWEAEHIWEFQVAWFSHCQRKKILDIQISNLYLVLDYSAN